MKKSYKVPYSQKITIKQKIGLIFLGIFFFFILLETGLRIGGFSFTLLQEHRDKISMKEKGTYRIMCLGESTTAPLGGNYSYSPQLGEILNQNVLGIKFGVINKGVVGVTTPRIVSRLEDNLDEYHPDMVIVMMGVNDERSDIIVNDDITAQSRKITTFFRSVKTYKLLRLLKHHIVNKIKAAGIQRRREDKTKFLFGVNSSSADSMENVAERYHFQQNKPSKVKEVSKKPTEIGPRSNSAYVRTGESYWEQGKYDRAIEMFKKAIELNPENDSACVRIGKAYWDQEEYDKAIEMFKKAIEINPGNDSAYVGIGNTYQDQGRHGRAIEMFKEAIEIGPRDDDAYVGIGYSYYAQGKHDEAIDVFERAIETNPKNDILYGALANHYYGELKKYKLAEEFFRKANELREKYYNPTTYHSYRKLREIVARRGIKLVCVQYPMRSIEPLKRLFEDPEGIIFVDNEKVFKKAVKQTSYDKYFIDMFGGDFGHCTKEGNRLLAENIANVIVKDYFSTYFSIIEK